VKTILGYEADEVQGKNFTRLIPEKSVAGAHEKFLESQKSADILSTIELNACRKDRTPVVLEFRSKRILDKEGNLMSISGITRDITGRKQMEEALRQVTKKLHLLTFVTFNDIRNAVFSLQGYLELSKDTITDDKSIRFLNMQQEALRKITHSLDFAQSYQDLGIKPPQWQNVNQVFLFAISHLDFSLIQRTIDLDVLEIFADSLLEKVFFNLSENVLKHGMMATTISIGYHETHKGLTIIFEDNGTGIPYNKKESLFEGDSGSKKGRGLFLSREILAITGITIIENGTAGKGARFEILVPKGAYRFTRDRLLKRTP
jgi:PAS domain S-box-containing protein